jgi:hypothetical protein
MVAARHAQQVDLPRLAAERPPPVRGADRFQYDLTVSDGADRHSLRVCEGSVPPPLAALPAGA